MQMGADLVRFRFCGAFLKSRPASPQRPPSYRREKGSRFPPRSAALAFRVRAGMRLTSKTRLIRSEAVGEPGIRAQMHKAWYASGGAGIATAGYAGEVSGIEGDVPMTSSEGQIIAGPQSSQTLKALVVLQLGSQLSTDDVSIFRSDAPPPRNWTSTIPGVAQQHVDIAVGKVHGQT